MTELRTCDECGKHLVTHRRGARFCGDECKNTWHNKHRRSQSTTGKRLEPVEGGVGMRGGNVRSVDEARDLQTASKGKDRWRLVMEVQIHRTLLATGHFHIDDLDCLNLPAEAFKVRGTLVSSVRRSGVMRSTGVYRKVSHKAANGRPAPIYEITPEGRTELPKLVGHDTGGDGDSGDSSDALGVVSGDLTPGSVPKQHKSGAVKSPPTVATDPGSPDPEVLQLEIPQESGSSAYGVVVDGEAA